LVTTAAALPAANAAQLSLLADRAQSRRKRVESPYVSRGDLIHLVVPIQPRIPL
jgi:hypothetical protein